MTTTKVVRQRYVPWVAIVAPSMVLSAFMMASQASVPSESWLWGWLGLAAFSGLLSWQKRPIGWLLLGLALGAALMQWQMREWQQHQLPSIWYGQSMQASVLIDGLPKRRETSWQLQAIVMEAPVNALVGDKVLLSVPDAVEPKPGQRWLVDMVLDRPLVRANPGGFDWQAWLFSQGIHAQGKANPKALQQENTASWRYWRWLFKSQLQSVLVADSPFNGLNIALIMGDTSGMTQAQWQVLRDTGTLHLAVVSGMHLTLIAGFAWLFAVGGWRLFPSERYAKVVVASVVAIIAATLFATLAGWTVPVQRAWIMLFMVVISIWLSRQFHPVLTLSWALLLVLLWDISAVLQVGFWLSFIATALLLWLIQRPNGWLMRLLWLHLGMSLFLAPFLVLFFHQIPTYAPLANLLAAPIVEFMLVPLLLLLASIAWLMPSVALLLSSLIGTIWQGLWQVLTSIAAWPHAVWLLSPALWWQGISDPVQRVTMLDVGKQAPVYIWQQGANNWLIGTGEQVGSLHSMDTLVLPSLVALGIDKLTGVVMTREGDDAQVGLAILQHRMPVQQVAYARQCGDQQLPWRFDGQTCWVNIDRNLSLTWQQPMTLPTPLPDNVMSLPLRNKNLLQPSMQTWYSSGEAVDVTWAKHRFSTQCDGAMTVQVDEKGVHLGKQYRHEQKRFYDEGCQ